MRVVGKSITRKESIAKVTGDAKYVVDMKMEGMIYAKMLVSPYPHAKIVSINVEDAKKIPGVFAVLTGKDLPYKMGLYMRDKDVIAIDKVRYAGEPVAAVAAVDEKSAEKAIKHIKVKYEPLKTVLDPVEALKPDAPLIHENLEKYSHTEGVFFPEPKTNIASHFKIRKGDV